MGDEECILGVQGLCTPCLDLRAQSLGSLRVGLTTSGGQEPLEALPLPRVRAGQAQDLLINLLLTGKASAEASASSQSEQNFPGMSPPAGLPLTPGLFPTPDFIPLVCAAPARLHWLCVRAGLLSPGS